MRKFECTIILLIGVLSVTLFSQQLLSAQLISSGNTIKQTQKTTSIKIRKDCTPLNSPNDEIYSEEPWEMHLLDPMPAAGSDGVKIEDVNNDDSPDLISGFEEGGVTRIYINPGSDYVETKWDYVELPSPDVEDALLFDLDNDGAMDAVTASEGTTNKIMFHWAPQDPDEYRNADKWQNQTVPATDGMTAWMFVVPMDIDGKNGEDLIVGSKRKRGLQGDDKAMVGWLQSPPNPRSVNDWKYHALTKAGWIMSIRVVDMDGDDDKDILISDRRNSSQTGVRWLENPGSEDEALFRVWPSHMLGVEKGEPMFLTLADLNDDGSEEILVPDLTDNLKIFRKNDKTNDKWHIYTVDYPKWAGPRGKAVSVADIDLDCNPDIILSFEEGGKVANIPFEKYKLKGRYSVTWGDYEEKPFSGTWNFHKVSGLKGRKFDLVNLIDLDEDGDLDIVTNDENEEGDGLGIIWYENPVIF